MNELARAGVIGAKRKSGARWTNPDFLPFTVVATDDDALEIGVETEGRFRLRWTVELTSTPCNYGGNRLWFLCPSASCSRRAGKLRLVDGRFLCRRCQGLTYASQRRDGWLRAAYRAQRLRARLGGVTDLTRPIPPRPPRMHTTTYKDLVAEIVEAQSCFLSGVQAQLERSRRHAEQIIELSALSATDQPL